MSDKATVCAECGARHDLGEVPPIHRWKAIAVKHRGLVLSDSGHVRCSSDDSPTIIYYPGVIFAVGEGIIYDHPMRVES